MRYAAPDPFIDPGVARADRRWRWTLAQTIPIAPDLAIVLQFERDVVSSNLPNFAYTNTQVVIGPQLRF
jgi:hypothetical protein